MDGKAPAQVRYLAQLPRNDTELIIGDRSLRRRQESHVEELIQTPKGQRRLHVCRDGTGADDDWVEIYELSFPHGQRQDIDDLRRQIERGTIELDETRDQDGTLYCLTLTEVFGQAAPRFLLACYTATAPEMRSLGIGSMHRRRLVELLQEEYPDHLGLFSEIESTTEPGLDAETLRTRQRRLNFFLRLGVRKLPVDYRFPSFVPGERPQAGELLWVPFGSAKLDRETLGRVVKRIYVEGYRLQPDDPFVKEELARIGESGDVAGGSEGGEEST
jgi:hypothetical protein